jgi:F0F1-type ATP synthase epsilon subunit
MATLNLKILSAKSVLLEDEIDMAVLPGFMGDIGVISGERTLSYILKKGTLYLFKKDKVYKRYFVMGGNFKAENNNLIINISSDDLIDLDNINKDNISKNISYYENFSVDNSLYLEKIEIYKNILSGNIESYYSK